MDSKTLWDNVLLEVEINFSKTALNMWFSETALVKNDEGMVVISVPNPFVRDWVREKYHKFILKSLRTLSEGVRSVDYIIAKTDDGDRKKIPTPLSKPLEQLNKELPLGDLINKEDNLNPRYTFENFVVGPFNELAYAASQAIIKKPVVYNPLFIYGDTGRGKTHLIQAVGNHIKANNREKRVFYVTCERFTQDYINAVNMGMTKTNNFKEKYRKYDVLIMDDIQFLSNTEKTQEELFHLFNVLYENNKQIIFSSDKHPNYIPGLEERLKSRFVAGMIVDIPKPDLESRIAILKSKARLNNLELENQVIDYLASSIDGNIRELEGILNSIMCQVQLRGRVVDITDIKNMMKNAAKPVKNISVENLVKIVANFYNLEEGIIYDKSRRKEVVKPRQLAMYILREDFNVSYPSIGHKLGDRDHTTVIHSCEKIRNELKVNGRLLQELNQIRALI